MPSSHLFEQVLFGFSILFLVKCGFSSVPPIPDPASADGNQANDKGDEGALDLEGAVV